MGLDEASLGLISIIEFSSLDRKSSSPVLSCERLKVREDLTVLEKSDEH